MPIARRSRIVRAIPIGIGPRDSSAADGHGWSAGAPRADVGGQESQLAALLEFEKLAEQKKPAAYCVHRVVFPTNNAQAKVLSLAELKALGTIVEGLDHL